MTESRQKLTAWCDFVLKFSLVLYYSIAPDHLSRILLAIDKWINRILQKSEGVFILTKRHKVDKECQ